MIALRKLRESVPGGQKSRNKDSWGCRMCVFEEQQGGRSDEIMRGVGWGQAGYQGGWTKGAAAFSSVMESQWEFPTGAWLAPAHTLRRYSAVGEGWRQEGKFYTHDGVLAQGSGWGDDRSWLDSRHSLKLVTTGLTSEWDYRCKRKDELGIAVRFCSKQLEEKSCHLLRWDRQQEKQIWWKIRGFILDLINERCLLHSRAEQLSMDVQAWIQAWGVVQAEGIKLVITYRNLSLTENI